MIRAQRGRCYRWMTWGSLIVSASNAGGIKTARTAKLSRKAKPKPNELRKLGSGRGTRTPDPRIMIFRPQISGSFLLFPLVYFGVIYQAFLPPFSCFRFALVYLGHGCTVIVWNHGPR